MDRGAEIIRKGPHKSVHCHLCKPPGYYESEDKPRKSMLETKTKINFMTETTRLAMTDIYSEPGEPLPDSTACICKLDSDPSPCRKCAPDKNKPPPKRTCRCPIGAIPAEEQNRISNLKTVKK